MGALVAVKLRSILKEAYSLTQETILRPAAFTPGVLPARYGDKEAGFGARPLVSRALPHYPPRPLSRPRFPAQI